jgi:hypothetical protein
MTWILEWVSLTQPPRAQAHPKSCAVSLGAVGGCGDRSLSQMPLIFHQEKVGGSEDTTQVDGVQEDIIIITPVVWVTMKFGTRRHFGRGKGWRQGGHPLEFTRGRVYIP